jgi:para-nitrobenzyl esterase
VHLPRHTFDPDANPLAKGIPMIIGSNRTETTNGAAEELFRLDEASLRARLTNTLKDRAGALIDAYKTAHPGATPSDLYFWITTDTGTRRNAITQAERKVQQGGAPTYMYSFNWKSPIDGGKWRSPHAIDLPFMFRNQRLRVMQLILGAGPEQDAVADAMTSAWAAFTKTGNPSNAVTGKWGPYDLTSRQTMVFDARTSAVDDPDGALRKFFMGSQS